MLNAPIRGAALAALFLAATPASAVTSYYANTTSAPSASSSGSLISEIFGPFMLGYSYTWSQYISPTIVGTVVVTVNEATNRTSSTTILHSEYQTNGSLGVLTRTDTDAAGTVTQVIQDAASQAVTVTYPHHLNYLDTAMSWQAILPTVTDETRTCCQYEVTTSPTPPLDSLTASEGSTDSADPSGWLYTLVGEGGGAQYPLDDSAISSIWDGSEITLPYTGCPHTTCGVYTTGTQLPPVAATSAAYLLATSTTTVSSADPADPAEPTSVGDDPPPPSDPTSAATSAQETGNPTSTGDDPSQPNDPTSAGTPAQETGNPTSIGDDSAQPDDPTSGGTSAQQTGGPSSVGDDPLQPNDPTSAGTAQGPQNSLPSNNQDVIETATNDPIAGIISLIASLTTQAPNGDGTAPAASTAVNDAENGGDSGASEDQNVPTPDAGADDTQGQVPAADPDGQSTATPIGEEEGEEADQTNASETLPAVVIEGVTVTQQTDSAFVVSGQTLSPGASVTLGTGTETVVVAFETSSALPAIVVGQSMTLTLSNNGSPPSPDVPSPADGTDLPDLTIGGSVVTADQSSAYVIDGQTLVPGSAIVVAGTTIELASGATELVVAGSTQALATADSIGQYIWSAIGGTGSPSGATSNVALDDVQTTLRGSSTLSSSALPQQTDSSASTSSMHSLWSYVVVASFVSLVLAL